MPIKVWNNLERKKNQINKYPYSTSHSLPLRWLVTGLAKTTAHQEVGSPSETRFTQLSELALILSLGILRSVVLFLLLLITGPWL